MTHGSLFAGIGGFDLAAEMMGWQNAFHCEINPFCRIILNYYWPESIAYDDIRKTDFTVHRNRIDIVTGGFPCQPYSTAGRRKGKADDRHLWPEMLRAVREISPRWIVGENVFGIINWGRGLVFHEVQADLETAGYTVFPYVLPAAGVRAPHKRERVFFIAHASNDERGIRPGDRENQTSPKWKTLFRQAAGPGGIGIVANANGNGRDERNNEDAIQSDLTGQYTLDDADAGVSGRDDTHAGLTRLPHAEQTGVRGKGRRPQGRTAAEFCKAQDWATWPTQSPVCNGNDGFPPGLDGITVSKWTKETISAGGNAIVPQVALQIFRAIEQFENIKP